MVHADAPTTLFDKIWRRHAVLEREGATLLHVGRHLLHDGSRNAFVALKSRGIAVHRPDRTFATPDHYVSTLHREIDGIAVSAHREMVRALGANAAEHGITVFGLKDERQGIVHVVGPEQGITLPGLVIVCGDSHTSTHGAFGALAFGIGTSEAAHVLATQSVWQVKPRSMRVRVDGKLPGHSTAKDLILAIIAQVGTSGGTGHVIEYAGTAIEALSMEARMTVCNMSIEAGARAGLIAPDATTIAYLQGRPFAPHGEQWTKAVADWKTLRTDAEAVFNREHTLDASHIAPMVTWGTSPQDAIAIDGRVPDPADAPTDTRRDAMQQALDYMGLAPGGAVADVVLDRVFIGSCTNARIEDLRVAAGVVAGLRVRVPTIIVPGSSQVKLQAEHEGLDRIFREAGIEWRESGCSMCAGTNGDIGNPGERIASTTNRNFVGRQGKDVRTHLVSPATAAASALAGRLADVRQLREAGAPAGHPKALASQPNAKVLK